MTPKYMVHPAGYPSRFGVIDVGLRCFHHCAMCFTLYMDGSDVPGQGMKAAKFHTKEHVLGLVDGLADSNHVGADVTGGEPTLHPNIIEMAERATERNFALRIITLGQYLMRPMHKRKGNLIDELLAAGLCDFRLSVHETDEENFKALTGGSWLKQKANMDYLDSKGFQYMSNTTVTLKNYKRLPSIAKEISQHNVYNSTLLFMLTHYEWHDGRAKEIQPKYQDAAKYAREFVAILEDKKIPVITRYAPLCTIAGLERTHSGVVGVRYDPQEWMNLIDHKGDPDKMTPEITRAMARRIPLQAGQPSDGLALVQGAGKVGQYDIIGGRGNPNAIQKVFPKECTGCSAMAVCDGIEPQYLERFGGSEFVPYIGDDRGNVLDRERVAYLPSYFVKLKPDADMKKVIGRAFEPDPISANPKVSVIVTCYNYGKYLAECLDSVAAQTYDNLEIIIVDDGSTDNTKAVCDVHLPNLREKLQSHPIYIYQDNSGQPAYPRNRGVSEATGELILCLDADDMLMPTMIEECVQALRMHPEASIAYTGVTCFGDSNQQWAAPPFDAGRLLLQNFITCASVYRKEMWEDVGGYKTNHRGVEDYALWVEASGLGYRGINIPRQLWRYRVHKDGIFASDVTPNFEARYRQIVLNNPHLYPPQMVTLAKEGKDVTRMVT